MTRMQSSVRAPVLSATRTRVSCWIIGPSLLRDLEDLGQAPVLHLGERTRLDDADGVADLGLILLVVGVQLARPSDDLLVARVRLQRLDADDDRLVHRARDDDAAALLAAAAQRRRLRLPDDRLSCLGRLALGPRALPALASGNPLALRLDDAARGWGRSLDDGRFGDRLGLGRGLRLLGGRSLFPNRLGRFGFCDRLGFCDGLFGDGLFDGSFFGYRLLGGSLLCNWLLGDWLLGRSLFGGSFLRHGLLGDGLRLGCRLFNRQRLGNPLGSRLLDCRLLGNRFGLRRRLLGDRLDDRLLGRALFGLRLPCARLGGRLRLGLSLGLGIRLGLRCCLGLRRCLRRRSLRLCLRGFLGLLGRGLLGLDVLVCLLRLLLCHYFLSRLASRSRRIVRIRAISRFASRSRAEFSSAPVDAWKRRLKSSWRVSAIFLSSSSSVMSRSCLALIRSSRSIEQLGFPLNDLGLDRELAACE